MHNVRFIGFMAILALATASSACRGSGSGDDDGGDDDVSGDGGVPDAAGGGTSIYDIQAEAMPEGTPVILEGVVVTALDAKGPGVYVQDPQGGPFSALFVFRPVNFTDVAVGDVVSVGGGLKKEFKYVPMTGTPDDKSMTQLQAADGGQIMLIKTGTATIAPQIVDALAIAADEDEAEKWESVLIKLENVAVVQAPRVAGSAKEMRVTGPFRVQDRIAPLSIGGTEFALNDCFVSITGVVNYFYDYKLLPRSEADYATGGTGCPAIPEPASSVTEIQDGTADVGALVTLTGVVVTAVAKFKSVGAPTPVEEHRVWVADAATGAPLGGVLVFLPTISGTNATIDTLVPGDVVNVGGAVEEFFDLTEIEGAGGGKPTIERTATGGAAPTSVTVTVATLANPALAEPYEGVLVKLENVKVVSANPDAPSEFGDWTVGVVGTLITIDDMMFKRPTNVAVDKCYSNIVGVLDYSFGKFKLEPRSAADVTEAASPAACN